MADECGADMGRGGIVCQLARGHVGEHEAEYSWPSAAAAADTQYGDSDGLAARLHGTTDAAVWAAEFMRMYRLYDAGAWIDEGLMIGWFANAIETGRAAGVKSVDEAFRQVAEAWERATGG